MWKLENVEIYRGKVTSLSGNGSNLFNPCGPFGKFREQISLAPADL